MRAVLLRVLSVACCVFALGRCPGTAGCGTLAVIRRLQQDLLVKPEPILVLLLGLLELVGLGVRCGRVLVARVRRGVASVRISVAALGSGVADAPYV